MLRLKNSGCEIDNVIFDLGNVLLSYSPRVFMAELGFAPHLHERLMNVLTRSAIWHDVDRGTKTEEDLIASAIAVEPLLEKEIRHFVDGWHDHFDAIPINVAALYRIKDAGCKVYVLSNFQEKTLKIVQERNVFFLDLDGAIYSCEHRYIKPEPEIYRLLLDTYSLNPARSVFFDDLEPNTAAARTFGIHAVTLPIGADVAEYFEFENFSGLISE